jgi:hypothetical protein
LDMEGRDLHLKGMEWRHSRYNDDESSGEGRLPQGGRPIEWIEWP